MNKEIIQTELQYKAVRSSGAGGQNVNKVATKVQIVFVPETSMGLTADEKATLSEKLSNRLSKEGSIFFFCHLKSVIYHLLKTLHFCYCILQFKNFYLDF